MAKNVIITTTARKKLVMARAGVVSLPPIMGLAFGNGGIDVSGESDRTIIGVVSQSCR